MGGILYVGGSGPNNYSRIQNAINDSQDGDTVFVFNESSPYYESIVVGKSITIQGENRTSTILYGTNHSYGVNITADNVTITGFTIMNFSYGIYLTSNNNLISSNILTENYFGIMTHYENLSTSVPPHIGHNTITNNLLINNSMGIFGLSGWNNTVYRNTIFQTEFGLTIGAAVNNNISFNSISENLMGVSILVSYNTTLYRNNISDTELGVLTFDTSAETILQNNFIGNNRSAMSHQRIFPIIKDIKIKLNLPIRRNVWDGNYWNEPRLRPYVIPGVLKLRFWIDWHPAQAPYDI